LSTPLAEKLRPKSLDEFIGQEHLVGKGMPLRNLLEKGEIQSMIFWGPAGCGKTTLAKLIPNYVDAQFVPFSAVGGSVKEVREIIAHAKDYKKAYEKDTILFVDEIHRFNKSQQDAFLPSVEDGTIILIGATTENPGFEINAPLVSRSQIYLFKRLSEEDLMKIVERVLNVFDNLKLESKAKEFLVTFSDGDARKVINAIEILTKVHDSSKKLNIKDVEKVLQQKSIAYDKKADGHYDTISAFIKSMRGSQPDATLHYLARMLKAGEDPVFIARRMVIFASEDISNADPMALVLATSTMQSIKMIGLPEAQIILAQCATYLATAKKSIASYSGLAEARADIENKTLDPIPFHLRNASNKVMQKFGYAQDHTRYPWLEKKQGKKVNQEYMPKNLKGSKYYKEKDLSE
jgi:putative ATPase